jgi:diadenosine tetraphosphate (Ap4A) HIT family hydrolase
MRTANPPSDCPLCHPANEIVLWRDADCRVIDAADPAYAGFSRVIWSTHVREMSDLADAQRAHVMRIVYAVEEALRALLRPDKINLAAFGNQVPHLHWHVIPRFVDDAHFPDPVWAAQRREGRKRAFDATALARELQGRLGV